METKQDQDQQWLAVINAWYRHAITQQTAATMLGVSQSYVAKVLRGKRKPHLTKGNDIKLLRSTSQPRPKAAAITIPAHLLDITHPAHHNRLGKMLKHITGYDNPNDCWLWQFQNSVAYPDLARPRAMLAGKQVAAAIAVWIVTGHKPPKPGHQEELVSLCHNPQCVNPAHHQVMTPQQGRQHRWQVIDRLVAHYGPAQLVNWKANDYKDLPPKLTSYLIELALKGLRERQRLQHVALDKDHKKSVETTDDQP